jgi:hypothetical protein
LTSSGGCLRPSYARPLGGPRISSAARHRLVWLLAQLLALLDIALSGCLPSCLLQGTTRLRLAACFGAPLDSCPQHLSPSGTGRVPHPLHLRCRWVCLLGAPPTGGTHFESNGGGISVATPMGAASLPAFPLWAPSTKEMRIAPVIEECNPAGNWSGTQEPQLPCAERARRRCAPGDLGGEARAAVVPTAVRRECPGSLSQRPSESLERALARASLVNTRRYSESGSPFPRGCAACPKRNFPRPGGETFPSPFAPFGHPALFFIRSLRGRLAGSCEVLRCTLTARANGQQHSSSCFVCNSQYHGLVPLGARILKEACLRRRLAGS